PRGGARRGRRARRLRPPQAGLGGEPARHLLGRLHVPRDRRPDAVVRPTAPVRAGRGPVAPLRGRRRLRARRRHRDPRHGGRVDGAPDLADLAHAPGRRDAGRGRGPARRLPDGHRPLATHPPGVLPRLDAGGGRRRAVGLEVRPGGADDGLRADAEGLRGGRHRRHRLDPRRVPRRHRPRARRGVLRRAAARHLLGLPRRVRVRPALPDAAGQAHGHPRRVAGEEGMTRERLDTVLYWLLAAGAIAVALWAQAGWNNYAVRLLTYSGLYVILVVSLNIVNGFVGIFSLGHIGFMAVGAYVSALATYPLARRPATFPTLPEWFQSLALPYPVALLLGGAAAALVAAVIGFPLLRLRGHYLALGSLALLVIVEQLAVNLHPVTRGSRGLAGIPMLTTPLWVWAVAVVVVYVAARIKSSGFGLLLGAIRLDDVAAAASGVRLTRYKMSAFVVSAFFAGVAGGLWAHLVGVIAPSVFSYDLTFRVIVMLIIGGL